MKGILLLNTGSPQSRKREDVKAFVGAMLLDPKLVSVPDWFRPILVKGIILPFRQYSSTAHYAAIWDEKQKHAPLIHHAYKLASKLEQVTQMTVEVAMRYEKPDVTSALKRLTERNDRLHEVIVFPLFPHYAESSYQTAVDEVIRAFGKQPYPFRIKFVEPYFADTGYIKALTDSLKPHLNDDYDKLICSFHSLPLSHVEAAWARGKEYDYVYQAKETIRLLQKELNLDPKKTRLTYHSAIGSKWLGPDLEEVLATLAKEGKKKVIAICPGFAADNLETLYDINIKARKLFLKHGGEKFTFIPCLNSNEPWVEAITQIISEY